MLHCCKLLYISTYFLSVFFVFVGYWWDLSGSGIYQARAAFNSQRHDLNISRSKISFCEIFWIIVLSFYVIIIPLTVCFISPGSAEYLRVRPKTSRVHLFYAKADVRTFEKLRETPLESSMLKSVKEHHS